MVVCIPGKLGSKSMVEFTSVPSISVSFVKTEILTGVSSLVVALSLLAIGASLTGVTVIVTTASSQSTGKPLSQTW